MLTQFPRVFFQFIPSPRYNIELMLGEEFFPTIGEYKGRVCFYIPKFDPAVLWLMVLLQVCLG